MYIEYFLAGIFCGIIIALIYCDIKLKLKEAKKQAGEKKLVKRFGKSFVRIVVVLWMFVVSPKNLFVWLLKAWT